MITLSIRYALNPDKLGPANEALGLIQFPSLARRWPRILIAGGTSRGYRRAAPGSP